MGAPPDGRFPRLGLVASPRPHGLQSGENFRVITVNCWQVCWAHERERGQIWPGCFTVGWEPGFFSVSSLLIRYQVGSPSSSESCVDSSHCTGLSGPSRGVPSPGESRGSGAAGQGLLLRARAQGPQAGAPPGSQLVTQAGSSLGTEQRVALSHSTCRAGGKALQACFPNEGHLKRVLLSS